MPLAGFDNFMRRMQSGAAGGVRPCRYSRVKTSDSGWPVLDIFNGVMFAAEAWLTYAFSSNLPPTRLFIRATRMPDRLNITTA